MAIDLTGASEMANPADEETTNSPMGKLAVMLQLNAETVQAAIDTAGPDKVAGFFIATGWGIAHTYEVPLDRMEQVNSDGR